MHKTPGSPGHHIQSVASWADQVPGVVMIHDVRDFNIVYMNRRGLDILGLSLPELLALKAEYYTRFFNREEEEANMPKIVAMLERNREGELAALFQAVRRSEAHPWVWYSTSLQVIERDSEGSPLYTIALAIPIDPEHHISTKISRLLEENNFLRSHHDRFHKLSRQEKRVLSGLARSQTSVEIAAALHISPLTVDTHRRNIKKKLHTSNIYELATYARAFDLI